MKIFLFFFLNATLVFSQETITVKYYEYLDFDFPIRRNDELVIDKENQKTYFLMDMMNQQYLKDISNEVRQELNTSDVMMKISRKNNDYIVIDFKERKITIYEDWAKLFYKIEDTFPILNWTLTNETKEINNILCNKAHTTYRGKSWEAWYAPTIPLSYGPWKLHGLPGLILEAKDDTNKFHYIASEIKFNSNDAITVPEKRVNKKLNMKEYLLMLDDFYNTPKDFGRDIRDTSPKFNFLERELKFEFDIKFQWEK